MTVKELIEALKKMPQDYRVVYTYDDIYGGIDGAYIGTDSPHGPYGSPEDIEHLVVIE